MLPLLKYNIKKGKNMEKEKVLTVIQETEILGKKIKMYGSIEQPLFLAKDVAVWIDYSQSNGKYKISQMLKPIDEDEKGIYNVATLGGIQSMLFLTENGLYECCMLSRKEEAKNLKKEIKKYLRNIRLTGAAIPKGREMEMVKNYFPSFSEETQVAMVNDLIKKNEELNQFYDDLLNTEGLMSMNTVSKELGGIGLKTLFTYLRKRNVMFYKDDINIPYQRFMDQKLFKVKESKCNDGKYRPVTYATKKGLEYIRKMMRKDGLLVDSVTN